MRVNAKATSRDLVKASHGDDNQLGDPRAVFRNRTTTRSSRARRLLGAIYLGSTLFTAPSGILIDRFGEHRIVVGSGVAMGGCVVVGSLVPNAKWLLFWPFAFGALYAASSPAGGRAILRHFGRHRGMAMGVRQSGAPLGGAIGAVILPVVALHFGGYRAALFCGGFICGACAMARAAQRCLRAGVRMLDGFIGESRHAPQLFYPIGSTYVITKNMRASIWPTFR